MPHSLYHRLKCPKCLKILGQLMQGGYFSNLYECRECKFPYNRWFVARDGTLTNYQAITNLNYQSS